MKYLMRLPARESVNLFTKKTTPLVRSRFRKNEKDNDDQVPLHQIDPDLFNEARCRLGKVPLRQTDPDLLNEVRRRLGKVPLRQTDPDLLNEARCRLGKVPLHQTDPDLFNEARCRLGKVPHHRTDPDLFDEARCRVGSFCPCSRPPPPCPPPPCWPRRPCPCPPPRGPWLPLLVGFLLGAAVVRLYKKYGCKIYREYFRDNDKGQKKK